MDKVETKPAVKAVSPYVPALRDELKAGSMKQLGRFELGGLQVQIAQGVDSVWAIIRRKGKGGLAFRAVHIPGGGALTSTKLKPADDRAFELEVESNLGRHRVWFAGSGAELQRLCAHVEFTPSVNLRFPYLPRDLYALDANDDPLGAEGNIEAAQRGTTSGLVYFRFEEPAFGSALYLQDLTQLNPYFLMTKTKPDGVVGGEWPELGFQIPTAETHDVDDSGWLKAGESYVLSHAIIVFREWAAENEQEMARQFLQMLGTTYKALELPTVEYRDWVDRAERTLRDLETAEQARRREYGDLYLMPYPDGEYPDAMIQLSVIQALHEYGMWRGEELALEAEFMKGVHRFYDKKIKTLRRYLPNVGERQGKDPDEVDSWYLYHPMLNLGRLALRGNAEAKDLLLRSVDYGIGAAQHFDYAWPITYKIGDFAIITKARGDERFGQTDVGGIYAYVMLQCFELTGEDRFVQEARKAIDKAKELRFDLLYQANLTTWGAVACLRLWRITDDASYLAQSYAYLAGFFHNSIMWQSRIGTAKDFDHFMGVICLHDAPYMAMYECFESFAGFEEYLAQAGPELDPAARMLVSEYCKYALHRAVFYYPDNLPKEDIQWDEHQSGVINPKLSFPLEDLYPDGQLAGQVGQEIYGAGAAFVFASRSHHPVENAPFSIYCDHFIRSHERSGERSLSISLDGGETCVANLCVLREKRKKLPKLSVTTAGGDPIRPQASTDDRIDFHVPAFGRVILTWE